MQVAIQGLHPNRDLSPNIVNFRIISLQDWTAPVLQDDKEIIGDESDTGEECDDGPSDDEEEDEGSDMDIDESSEQDAESTEFEHSNTP